MRFFRVRKLLEDRRSLEAYNYALKNLQKNYKDILDEDASLQRLKDLPLLDRRTSPADVEIYLEYFNEAVSYINNNLTESESWRKIRLNALCWAILNCVKDLLLFVLDMFPDVKNLILTNTIKFCGHLLNIKFSEAIFTPDAMENTAIILSIIYDVVVHKLIVNTILDVVKTGLIIGTLGFITSSNSILARQIREFKIIALILRFDEVSPIKIIAIPDLLDLISSIKQLFSIQSSIKKVFIGEMEELQENLTAFKENDYLVRP